MTKKIIHPLTILYHLTPKMLYGIFFQELKYLRKFRKLLKQMKWDDLKIKTGGYAANGSFLCHLLRIYSQVKPERILELGSGETSKLLCRYISENGKASGIILEDNLEWFEHHENTYSKERVSYKYCPLIDNTIEEKNVKWYDYAFPEINETNKFNLIIIDGPKGTNYYSRAGILCYLPKIIDNENFILIFDDTSRKGEVETIKLTRKILNEENISFQEIEIFGTKKQTCFYSEKYSDLKNL